MTALCFGSAEWSAPPLFVDEFELPKRHDGEKGAGPDNALLWSDRLWMIELKTETSSHRPAQISTYLQLARHHYPSRRIHLTYLTPEMAWDPPASGDARLAHMTWSQIVPLITDIWGDGDPLQRRGLALLVETIDGIGSRRVPERLPAAAEPGRLGHASVTAGHGDPVQDALALADATSRDGRQRALDYIAGDLDELLQLRLEVKEAIGAAPAGSAIRFVRPWLWRVASTGHALTNAGKETGYEIRLSRYQADHY